MTYTICLNTDWILQGNVWMCDAFRHTLDQECFASFCFSKFHAKGITAQKQSSSFFISGWAHEVHYAIKLSSELLSTILLLLPVCFFLFLFVLGFLLLLLFEIVIFCPNLWAWCPSMTQMRGTSCPGISETRSKSSEWRWVQPRWLDCRIREW